MSSGEALDEMAKQIYESGLDRDAPVAQRLLNEISILPGLHIFHTLDCGRGPVYTDTTGGWECDIVNGAQCPLERQMLNCTQDELLSAVEELERTGKAKFDRNYRPGWWSGELITPKLERPKKARSSPLPPDERRAPSTRLRFLVFQRDKFTCVYCGRKSPDVELSPDHVVPFAKGGKTTLENLITSCRSCNAGKGATIL